MDTDQKPSVRSDRAGEILGEQTESRFPGERPKEIYRTYSRFGVFSTAWNYNPKSRVLRPTECRTLQQSQLAVSGSIPEFRQESSRPIIGGSGELHIEGIQLERGLAFRPIDSIIREEGSFQVYNFSCDPEEAYEANGFVVHNCFYVSSDYKQKHSREELDWGVLQSCLTNLSTLGTKAITWTGGGDPSVYTHIDKAIEYTHSLGLQQGIFTNAYDPLQYPELLDWIRITITEKFLLTKHVKTYIQHTKVGVNYNLCKENEEHLPRLVKQAKDIGAHYFQVRPALADRYDLQKPIECPTWLKDYETPDFKIVLTDYKWEDYLKPHDYPICHGHSFVPFIWHNGDVAVCAYHFGREDFTFGNLNQKSFKQIWEGDRRKAMLEQGVNVIPECQHCCKLHEINKSLSVLKGDITVVEDEVFL